MGFVIIYAELCKNVKHIGYFTHIINICVAFIAMRESHAKCVRLGRSAVRWIMDEVS